MPRYFLQLAYNGSNYHGWQSQDNAHTVQAELEGILTERFGKYISITGAGRTDSGVHASCYMVHFDLDTNVDTQLVAAELARMMPADIACKGLYKVKADSHTRFSALSREYNYVISKVKDPYLQGLVFYYHPELLLADLREASGHLIGEKDFSAFEKLGSDNSTSICNIMDAEWIEFRDFLIFRIRANRFLRNMVRAIVGTLIDVGRGKISPSQFEELIHKCDRSLAGTSAPAQGLYLTSIEYPADLFIKEVPPLKILPSFLTGCV